MGVVANPLVVRIFINSTLNPEENGWSERWPIWETDWNAGLQIAAKLVSARQNVLASNAYIEWACLGTVAPPYYEQTVVTDTLAPLPQWGQAAFDMQGILFTLATSEGINAPRLFRAVEGASINAKKWQYADMLVPLAPPPLPADLTTASKDLLWQNTLATFRMYASTQQPMSDGHHGEGDGYWVEPYAQMVYRQVSSRYVGRPWRRMSWESFPYWSAPQFSPCGCVVTVDRVSYAIPCRFGVGWALRGIHYYEARNGATVMTFRTPFCAFNRSKEYTDFSGVGEARKCRKSDWTRGPAFGNAPGVMWTGPESYFEGYATEPPIPTPSLMLPACDKPPPTTPFRPLPPPLFREDEFRQRIAVRWAPPRSPSGAVPWIARGSKGEPEIARDMQVLSRANPAVLSGTITPSNFPAFTPGRAIGDAPEKLYEFVIFNTSPKKWPPFPSANPPKRIFLPERGLQPIPEWIRGRLFPFAFVLPTTEFSWMIKRSRGEETEPLEMDVIRKVCPQSFWQQRFGWLPKPQRPVWDSTPTEVSLTPRRTAPITPPNRPPTVPPVQRPEKIMDVPEVLSMAPARRNNLYPFT